MMNDIDCSDVGDRSLFMAGGRPGSKVEGGIKNFYGSESGRKNKIDMLRVSHTREVSLVIPDTRCLPASSFVIAR